jgi:gliding motility-associated-like protein
LVQRSISISLSLYLWNTAKRMAKKTVFLLLLVPFLWCQSFAQLCNGSLGDPVAWITFGAGSGSGPALPASVTNYTFTGSSCPNDGSYTIGNLSFGCFSSSWHTIVGDHTPDDAGGKYMLVNASNTPGVFYVDTVRGLCAGTTYEFSSYIMNVLKPSSSCGANSIKPDLTFTIETLTGTVITTYNTGSITETENPTWRQFGTFFETPANVSSVVVRIRNNAPGGCGNDLALDDITFKPCGPRIDTKIAIDGSKEKVICIGDERTFLLSGEYSNSYADPRLQWQVSENYGQTWTDIPGATNATYLRRPTGEGYYDYRLLIANGGNINNTSCRIASQPVRFIVTPPPFISLTNYVFSCYGSTVAFAAAGGNIYEWKGPNGFSSTLQSPSLPNVQFDDTGWYRVKVTTIFGCSNTDSTFLKVYPAAKLEISKNAEICAGQSVQLTASGGTSYSWEPRTGLSDAFIPNPVARPTETTRYKLTITNDAGCYDTGNVLVTVNQLPVANAGPDLKTLKERPVQLQGTVSGTNVSFQWSPAIFINSVTSVRPTVLPVASFYPQEFIYRLDVFSNKGCGSASDEMKVTVFETIKVPNTFTPNGDGYNDNWEIDLLSDFRDAIVEVYNTAGQLVYRSVGYSKPWDGRRNGNIVPAGTYYYVIDLKVLNARKLSGYITVIK